MVTAPCSPVYTVTGEGGGQKREDQEKKEREGQKEKKKGEIGMS